MLTSLGFIFLLFHRLLIPIFHKREMRTLRKMVAIALAIFTLPWISCGDSTWQSLADSLVDDGLSCGLIAGLDGTVWASAGQCSPRPNEIKNILQGFESFSASNGAKFEGFKYYKLNNNTPSDRKSFQGRSGIAYLLMTLDRKALVLGLSYSREKLNEHSRRVEELADVVSKLAV